MSSSDAATAKPVVIDDADVKELLMENEFLEAIETGEGENRRVRVRCELTQHEMLPRKDAIETHLKSKKFVKAKEWYCYDYSKYEPYIVAHRRKPKSLFCNVTNTVLNRIPSEVEKHVSGKKFLRLKEHVKFTERKSSEKVEGGDENEGEEEDDFDANAFEFENAQVLLSDDEDEGNAGVAVKGAGKKTKKPQNDSDDDDDDNDEDEEDEEEVYEDDDDEEAEDSDMAEFYPDDEDDDEGRLDHETILKLAAEKKRKAADGEDDGAKDADKKGDKKGDVSSKQPAAKKQKKAPKPVSKARISSKDRRQQPKQQKASFKK